MARLRADRSLLPGAVEELLRYTSPVNHATFRFTAEPVKIGGTLIPAREPVLVAIASANRDPDRYPAPDQVDLGATPAGTWRSATASTTAPARRWPGWKARSRSAACSRASPA